MTFSTDEMWRKIMLSVIRVVTVVTNDRESIPPMHLYRLVIMLLNMNVLLLLFVRPIGMTGKRRFLEINLVSRRRMRRVIVLI